LRFSESQSEVDPSLFKGFSIGAPVLTYEMSLQIAVPSFIVGRNFDFESLTLKNGKRVAVSADRKVGMELVGDFQPLQMPPALSNKLLFVPKYDQYDTSYDLLVDREKVSLDGNECNKVGTSYNAFNTM